MYVPGSLIDGPGSNDCFMIRTVTGLMRLTPGMQAPISDEEFENLKREGKIGEAGPLKEVQK